MGAPSLKMPQTYLSVTLLLAVCTGTMASNMMEVDPEVKGYFDAMDDNKDGQVTMPELTVFLDREHDSHQTKWTDHDARSFFKELDSNANGKISLEELVTWQRMKRMLMTKIVSSKLMYLSQIALMKNWKRFTKRGSAMVLMIHMITTTQSRSVLLTSLTLNNNPLRPMKEWNIGPREAHRFEMCH